MAPWITKAELISHFGEKELVELTDRATPATGAVVDAVVDAAIAEAQELILGIVRRKYPAFDGTTVPAGIKAKARHITRYFLFDPVAPDLVRQNYEDALEWLKDAAFTNDDLGIVPDSGEAGSDLAAGSVRVSPKTLAFGPDFEERY